MVGLVVEYKEKMDKEEHHLKGSMTSEGARKDHFFVTFVKRGEKKK